ncbi:sulfatase-like hydrolase/transferase [Halomontanus rarus]|uniref:sulfatase-like hydrolase/transferase n=1 Tax=Halomontanus rarus TaxID=3034020 RepID=UPI0023E8C54D|nr:sulfatase-like hydrolase/transferase [Halovivax sp. TS33]
MSPESTERPSNVLFIFTDQQRVDSLSAYGNDWVETPNLDRLASGGIRFDNAYTPTAICSPARAAIITGMRPHRTGIERNVKSGATIANDYPCYPRLLREAGYEVGHSGKWHVGQPPDAFGVDGEHIPGWFYDADHPDYCEYLENGGYPELRPEHLVDAFPDDGREYQSGAADTRPTDASFTSYVTARAIERIETYAADPDTPFYQGVHYFGPHNPYYLPEKYYHMYDPADVDLPASAVKETFENKPWTHRVQSRMAGLSDLSLEDWRRFVAVYHGWVTFIDDQVGRLLEALEEVGVADDTAVVFTSDHGSFLTAHKMHDKGPAMYEDIYNVPFITSGFGPSGHVEDRFVSLLDLAPTFLDLTGVDIPDEYDGRSLLNLYLTDGEIEETAATETEGDADDTADLVANPDWREHLTAEFHGHFFAYEQRMIRRNEYKLVLNEFDTAELYDLAADPNELTNRIGDPAYGDVARALYDALVRELASRGDPFVEAPTRKLSQTSAVGLDGYDSED